MGRGEPGKLLRPIPVPVNLIKELLTTAAIILTFIAFAPYMRGIVKGEIRPHLFSWVIWGTTTLIVFFAIIKGEAGT